MQWKNMSFVTYKDLLRIQNVDLAAVDTHTSAHWSAFSKKSFYSNKNGMANMNAYFSGRNQFYYSEGINKL